MIQLKNDRLLRALRKQPVDATPIWIMRQAGRYLPEYRQVRTHAKNFMTLCKTPELACEVTMQPIARFQLDAAIIFSDILTIPEAMGMEFYFLEGEGPHFPHPVRSAKDIKKLGQPDMATELRYVMDAIRLVQYELNGNLPLIGFSGSPWTLATYMVEGGSSKSFDVIKKMLYVEPNLLHTLLAQLTNSIIAYLNAQIAAGVQAVMIFDTWGGILTPPAYQSFSLAYMAKIIAGIKQPVEGEAVPVILFTKNGGKWLAEMAATGCQAIGLDWTINLGEARDRVGKQVALQGNMDPALLYASPERIRQEVKTILADFGHGSGHIFNLGHGISKDVPPEHVEILVDAVHELSRFYHQ